jgi:hypothetical protein
LRGVLQCGRHFVDCADCPIDIFQAGAGKGSLGGDMAKPLPQMLNNPVFAIACCRKCCVRFDPDQSVRLQSFLAHKQGECGLDELEEVMTTLKGLILATALLAGGSSLGFAQNAPATTAQPPVVGVAGSHGPASSKTARHHGTKHHRVYMMSVNRTHKGSKLTPTGNAKPQMKQ